MSLFVVLCRSHVDDIEIAFLLAPIGIQVNRTEGEADLVLKVPFSLFWRMNFKCFFHFPSSITRCGNFKAIGVRLPNPNMRETKELTSRTSRKGAASRSQASLAPTQT